MQTFPYSLWVTRLNKHIAASRSGGATMDLCGPTMVERPRYGFGEYDVVPVPVSTGTTIMAVEFDGGVVIGADTRVTAGQQVTNRVVDKLYKLHDRIYCCRSGSAADTEMIADTVAYQLDFFSAQMGESPSVRVAAQMFNQHCYSHREDMVAGMIVAGWDRRGKGQVYYVPVGGMLLRQAVAIGGSGSTYITGFVDSAYKPGMDKDECLEFTARGIAISEVTGGILRETCGAAPRCSHVFLQHSCAG
uniref:proteasome subunit beta type-6-like isoform X2 n=1 Tax=Myxine glutinosa TaxID=7769 RepID=UPI00358F92C7